ncbi:MAG: hypothetical protein NC080_07380 [Paraprevotella sp.]|nr:hypothetical protein [Paraprevotella sp.]
MPFEVIPPPENEDKLKTVGQRIISASYALDRPIDIEGFLHAWISGIRVILETDNDGKDIGIAFCAMGDRWLYKDRAVSVMFKNVKDEQGFFSFVKSVAVALGAKTLIVEADQPLQKLEGEVVQAVREISL